MKMDQSAIIGLFILVGAEISSGNFEPPLVDIFFPQDLADVDFQNSTIAIMTNSYPNFNLNCNASYPIEWLIFYGEDEDDLGEQKNLTVTRRIVSDFENASSYIYTASLRFQFTGKVKTFSNYSCKAVADPNLQTHVITTTRSRRNVILMQITSDKKYIQTPLKVEDTKACPVIATVSDTTEKSSCWKCEKSNGTELELDFLGCGSPIECNNNFRRQNQRQSCLKIIPEGSANKDCKRIGSQDYNPKILICKNYGPVLAQVYYFGIPKMGKTPKIFFDWSEMEPKEMLYIHPIANELFYGQNITIICEMSKYYFSYGSWFGIEMDYGNKNNGVVSISYRQTGDLNQQEWKGTFASTLNLTLSFPSPSKVYCFAPIWNSTEWINASVDLQVQKGEDPEVLSVLPEKSDKFDMGQINRTIVCRFNGKPTPQVEWFGPIGSYFTTETDMSSNLSKLILSEISYASIGDYRCKVTSFLGSEEEKFTVQDPGSSTALKTGLIIGGVVLLAVGTIVSLVVVRLCRIVKTQREALRLLTETEIKEFVEGNPTVASRTDVFDKIFALDALPYDKKYEISQDKVNIDYKLLLGAGAFGKVYKGKIDMANCNHYVNLRESSVIPDCRKEPRDHLEVAIKTCDKDVDVVYFKAILSEIKVMAYIGQHKNVVGLVGACTRNIRQREVYIIVEFCPKGSLEMYLRRHRNSFVNMVQYGILKIERDSTISDLNSEVDKVITTKDLLKWSFDIASGMQYLHEKKVIHGDLATRNILLTEDMVAKIGDFGLARQLVECSNYVKKTQCPLPWRYLAPESLRDLEFSVKSDVWAFGVTLWELFTLSEIPYPGISWSVNFLTEIQNGLRLTKPVYATNDMYEFMLKCWKLNASDRPEFLEIKSLCSVSLRFLVPKTSKEYLTVVETDSPTYINDLPSENNEEYLVLKEP